MSITNSYKTITLKNNIILLIAFVCTSKIIHAQNVGIGTTTPLYPLHLQTPANTDNWGFMHTNGNVYLGSFIYQSGIAEFGTRSNHPLYLFANNIDNPPAITIDKSGVNVGMGTIVPAYNLDIHGTGNTQFNLREGTGGQTALFSRYTNRLEIQASDAFQLSVGGIDQRNLCVANNGFTGIGTSTPATRLQVLTADASYGISHTNGTVTIGTYIGNNGGWLGTQSNHPLYFFTNNSNALMALGTNGYFGVGTITPANKLQIGSVGSTGYGGNDIAFGNGTQASGIAQTTSVAQWYSTTDIALMPKGNGHGRVGINTTTPIASLDVEDYVQLAYSDYYHYPGGSGYEYLQPGTTDFCSQCAANVSIYAHDNIMGLEVDAFSDARIKDIKGVSNTARDLDLLNTIQVTDYTLKDKIKYGNKQFKKVIAQQVETIYPQVVSTHVDFIPNVYQAINKMEKTNNGYLLHFDSAHHISKQAKKIKLLIEGDNTMKQYDIISIPSDNEMVINAENLNGKKIFVYGEEVNDFRTVDYEGLTTLNISATQELSKIIKQQQTAIDDQNEKIKTLNTKMEKLMNEIELLKKKN